MSINRRQANLIKALASSGAYIPTQELASRLSCSERTVRNDVRAINAFLAQNDIPVQVDSKRGNGIRLLAPPTLRERVFGLVQERALSLDPALDRFYRGILLLTCDYSRNYSIDALAHAILTNRQQAQEDIRAWNDMMTPYDAHIERGHLLTVEGPEENIRFFVTHSLFELAPTAMKRRVEPQLFAGNRDFLFEEIEAVERGLDLPLTDNARHELAIYLQVSALRIRKGHILPHRPHAASPVFSALFSHLEAHYGIAFEGGERATVIELFSITARRWTPDFQESYIPTRTSANLADDLIRALGDHYGQRPAPHLRKPLALLIEAGLEHRRLERAAALPPEISWTVRFENMTLFMRLGQILCDTPSLAKLDLYETDCTRIAMLLLNFMEDLTVSDTWRAGLVVNCGVEQVFFARDRIERLLPFLRIVRVIPESEHVDGSSSLDGLDFLVSFDPIESKLPVAVISSAITERDRRNINETIVGIGPHGAQGAAAFSSGLTTRPLDCDSTSFAPSLRRALTEDGLWDGTDEEFAGVLEACSFAYDSTLFLTMFCHEVASTGTMVYEVGVHLPFLRERITRVAVLAVASADERLLGAATQNFRKQLVAEGLAPAEV